MSLPDHDYFYFAEVDKSMKPHTFFHLWINLKICKDYLAIVKLPLIRKFPVVSKSGAMPSEALLRRTQNYVY